MSDSEVDILRALNFSQLLGPVELGSALNITGVLKFYNSSSLNATIFQSGNASTESTYTFPTTVPAGNNYVLGSSTAGVLSWINAPGTYAPVGSAFVTIGSDATLTSERALTQGTAISVVDGGAGSTVTINNTGVTSAVATSNRVTVSAATGAVTFSTPQDLHTTAIIQFAEMTASVRVTMSGTAYYKGGATSGHLFNNNADTINIIKFDNSGNVVIAEAALNTTATDRFFYISTCAGVPSGTPTTYTGRTPIVYDSTNNHFYIYNSGWRSVLLT